MCEGTEDAQARFSLVMRVEHGVARPRNDGTAPRGATRSSGRWAIRDATVESWALIDWTSSRVSLQGQNAGGPPASAPATFLLLL